jgi:hemoglobin/transferrin/lactoferrin receptor protein
MRTLFAVCAILFTVWTGHAQIVTIRDAGTKAPLDMVVISGSVSWVTAITNAKGMADISAFASDTAIEFKRQGYRTEYRDYNDLNISGLEVYMTVSSIDLSEIVISATRWDQSGSAVPNKVTRITPRDIALLQPQTAADMLGASGEVFIQKSQQGGGSPMIRGFSTNRLLYAVDGIRMNTAIFRAGNIQNVISLDAFAIENAEVIFGPGSIIYGSDAIGGVMAFQTLTPQFSLDARPSVWGKALSRVSSANNELTSHIDVGVGWKRWASVTSLTYSQFGDLRMGSHGPEEYLRPFYVQRQDSADVVVTNPDPEVQRPTGYSQINLMQKLRYRPSKNWDLQVGFHYSETSPYSRYDRLIELQGNGLPSSGVWNYGPQIWSMTNAIATHAGSGKLYDRMTLRLAYQYFEESRIDRRFNHHRLRTNLEEVRAYSANLDFERKSGKHSVYYGLEYVLNDVASFGSAIDIRDNSPMDVPDRYPASEWMSSGAYASYQYRMSDLLLIQAGARFNAFNLESDFTRHLEFYAFDFTRSSINNSSTTGSLGLIVTPDKTWKIGLNASTGFRAPNVDDVGKIFDFADGEVVVPNTNLEAEYAWNGELDIAKVIAERVKLDVAFFATRLDNAMVRREFTVAGQDSIEFDGAQAKVYAIQNAAFSQVYGFNAGVDIDLNGGFSIGSRFNYQIGEEEMDGGEVSRSRHAAPAFGLTRLTFQSSGLTLQLYAMYSAEVSYENLNEEERQKPAIYAKDGNGNPYSPSWYTLSFKMVYEMKSGFAWSAGMENITDQRYRPYSSGLVAPGRNMVLSLRASF